MFENKKVTIDESNYPIFLINGEKYELLCEYSSRINNNLVNIHVKEDGKEVVVDFGDGTACFGYFSFEPGKITELLNYIEATISLKSGFDCYSEDLVKHFETVENKDKKFPIICNEFNPKNSFASKIFNRIHQDRFFKEYFSKPFEGSQMVCSVEYTEQTLSAEEERSSEFNTSKSNELRAVETPAKRLPQGWHWSEYEDGSGGLESPTGKSYFSYDLSTYYSAIGGIEYKKSYDTAWDVFWGTLENFKFHAECVICKENYCLGTFNVPEIMNGLANNAWSGTNPTTVCLIAGDNIVKMEGYTYEPSYEVFSTTASISLNDEILYGQDSRTVEAYRYEVYMTGKYDCLDDAISHIKEKINVQELKLVSNPSQVGRLISRAADRSEHSKTDDTSVKENLEL